MEWLKDYWFVVVFGLVAAMFIFGRKSNRGQEVKLDNHQHGAHTGGKTRKSGHGCCH